MPSQRRMRFYGILAVVTIIVLLYITKGAQQTQTSDFYTKTQQALQEREHEEAAKQRDAESVQQRLRAAEEQAKKAADEKYTSVKDAVEGPSKKGVAGRVEFDQDDKKVPGVAAQGGRSRDQAAMQKDETLEDHEVEMAMNTILKQSPGRPPPCSHALPQANSLHSNHLFQVVLPVLQEGEAHPPREISHRSRAVRCRAGH